MSMRERWLVLGVVLASACGEEKPAVPIEEMISAPPVIEIVGTDYAYTAPDTMPAGPVVIRFRAEGQELHHVTLVRLNEGKTLDDLVSAVAGGQMPPGIPIGGPNAPAPGGVSEATVSLAPGNYALVCFIPSPDGTLHLAKGMMKSITVAGSPAMADMPRGDVTLRLSDYAFELSSPLTAGHHVIQVEVSPGQPHEVLLVRLEPGKTGLEVAEWAEKPIGPPPGIPMGGISALGAGETNLLPVDLEPGNYAFICFLPDAGDGKPHFLHGMVKEFTVS
ncbi:MAG: hypothetical protein AB7R55_05765 [Gemmatimonadales bacterium]